MYFTPLPDDGDTPVHAVSRVVTDPGEKGEIVVEPETAGSTHFVPTVAVSKRPNTTYTVEVDDTVRFGPDAHAPPTDPDDLATTFVRALELESELKITVKDLRTTGSARDYEAQVIGWKDGA